MAATGVKTNFYGKEGGKFRAQFSVHRFDGFSALGAAPHIRLVRDHDQKKSGFRQLLAAFGNVGIELEVTEVRRRKREAIADHRAIENAVAIEKYGALTYLVLSHFVCATFSFGWLTKRCHTTAWNASECGVVLFGFTVGITMTTSATFAV